MAELTSVEHVYGRRTDDPANLRLLNSLRYYNDGRFRVKDWSPEVHRHEVASRKREREEKYIKSHADAPKPVMLVQKKEIFSHTPLSRSVGPLVHNEAFFKLTENSRPVESVAHEILKEKSNGIEKVVRLGRKQKSVPHLTRRLKPLDKTNRIDPKPVVDVPNALEFYKIEGIEFLPEGFIELEPVLFHDEYRFYSDKERLQFTEEQKKLVAKRRQQYQERQTKKMRKVTLFVVKDFLQNLDAFFEAWFADNRRRMTAEEVDYLAREMAVQPEAVRHMQEEFLQKKRQKNANTLNIYFQGRDFESQEKLSRLPRFLQEYFYRLNKQDYSHVKSRHMDVHDLRATEGKTITKASSNVTFRAPSFTNLDVGTKNTKFFEEGGPKATGQTSTPSNLKITMEQIVNGTSNVKVKDFRVQAVEGVATKSLNLSGTLPKSAETPDSIDHLHSLLDAFQKEKLAHTKHQNRDLPANCETRIDADFNLMNCKITMQLPGEDGSASRKKFKGKGK